MSSYPVLNNRPIDQWRVTDLKDELRKRRLPVKGLKEELVRRLFDSIQSEQAASEATEDVELSAADDQQPDVNVTEETTGTVTEVCQETIGHFTQQVEVPGSRVGQESMISAVGGPPAVDVEAPLSESMAGEGEMPGSNAGENLAFQEMQPHTESTAEPVIENTSDVQTNETIIVNDDINTDVKSDLPAPEVTPDITEASKIQKQDSATAPVATFTSDVDSMDTAVTAAPVSNDGEKLASNSGLGSSIYDEENKNSKLLNEDRETIISKPNNQVHEVTPDLGSQIKCESISSDDISTNKKNSVDDNMDANNFDLELEVKPKMVEPSSGITSLGGDLQPLDDEKELVKNQSSLEDIDAIDNVDSYKKDSPEGGSPEKLNLDRSSGDESMEEDFMESRQAESNMKSDDHRGTTELSLKDVKEVGLPDSVAEASSIDTKEVIAEEKPAASAEKRKLEGLFPFLLSASFSHKVL
jgi:apoptotic chromatin condensation inducer in the nucleus